MSTRHYIFDDPDSARYCARCERVAEHHVVGGGVDTYVCRYHRGQYGITALEAAQVCLDWLRETHRIGADGHRVMDEQAVTEHGYTRAPAALTNEGGSWDWDMDLHAATTDGTVDLGSWYVESVNNWLVAIYAAP